MADEELVLKVRLDDQASAQIATLKQQMSGLGTGPAAAGQERMRRQSRDSAESLAALQGQLGGLALRFGTVAGIAGVVAGKLTDLGLQFIQRTTDIKSYATEMQKLQQASYTAGTSSAQLKSNINVFRESGVDAGEAGAQLQKYSETMADLSRVNSQTRRELMRGLRPGEVSDMQAFINDIMSSDPNEALNKIKAFGEDIRKYQTELYGPEAGAKAQANFYRTFGMDSLGKVRGEFRAVSADQQRLFDDRAKQAERYLQLSEKQNTAWERSAASVTAVALEFFGLNNSLETTSTWAGKIAGYLEQWETKMRGAKALADAAAPQPGTTGAKDDYWWRRFDPFDPRNVAREQAVAPELQPPPPPPPTTRRATTQQQNERFRIREEEQRRQQEQQRLQEEADRRKAQGLPPLVPPPRPPSAPVRTRYSRPSRLGIPPPQPAPAEVQPAPSQPPPAPPTEPQPPPIDRQPVPPPPPPAPDVAEELRREEQLRRRRAAAQRPLPAPLPPPAVQPAPAPPQPPVIPAPPPAPVMPLTQPAPAQPIPAPPPAPVQPIPAPQAPAAAAARPTPNLFDLLNAAKPAAPPSIVVQPQPKEQQQQPQPIILPKPLPPVVVPQPQAAPVIVPQLQPQAAPVIVPPRAPLAALREEQPSPSAFATGGRTIDLAGTGNPNQAAAEKGQTQNWLDTSFAAAYDRAAQREVSVNGTGQISVDFKNMPRGVTAQAQGGGLFRKTEISRQVQMEAAATGPTAPAGGAYEA